MTIDRDALKRRCKGCDAEIFWAISSTTGKRVPIDAEPVPDGHLHLFAKLVDGEVVLTSHMGTKTSDPKVREAKARGQKRYMSHFATCPVGKKFRKKR